MCVCVCRCSTIHSDSASSRKMLPVNFFVIKVTVKKGKVRICSNRNACLQAL